MWSGDEALKLHLGDQIGGLQTAIEYAAELAHQGPHPKITQYPRKETVGQAIQKAFNGVTSAVSKMDSVNRQMQLLEKNLRQFACSNDPMGIYSLLPMGIEFN